MARSGSNPLPKPREIMREKKLTSGKHASKRRTAVRGTIPSTLDLVRKGVRRFILDGATFDDFRKAVRLAAKRGKPSPNPLPGGAFRKIVKDAVAERKRNGVKRSRT
jgi:hypothetical protein